ncbi:MAG: MFS transporter, partial [Nitrospira sp.]
MSDVRTHSQGTGSTPSRARGWELVKTRDFGFLFAGQTVSQIGDSLNKVALLWFVYDLTGSALKMAVVGLLQTLPPLLFGPLIGVYLDRVRKKPVMIGVDLLRTLMVLLIPVLFAMGALSLDRLYLLVFATAIFSTIFGPALTSAVPLIVPKERLIAANALLQTTTNVGLLVGPAVSGLGIALIGAQNVLYVDAATFFISALCLFPIRVHERIDRFCVARKGLTEGIASDLMAGFRFVFVEQKTVTLLMLTATLYSVGISAFIFLLPVFAKEVLGVGPIQLGWLWSALGVGMVLASLSLTSIAQGDVPWRLRFMSGALAVGGIAVAALGFFDTPIAAGVLIAVIGGSTALFTPLVWT